jgi:hypothetical protein
MVGLYHPRRAQQLGEQSERGKDFGDVFDTEQPEFHQNAINQYGDHEYADGDYQQQELGH